MVLNAEDGGRNRSLSDHRGVFSPLNDLLHSPPLISETNRLLILRSHNHPDQTPLAVRGGARGKRQGAAPEEAAPADPRSAEGAQAEPGLGADGAPAAPGPAGEAAALPRRRKERYTNSVGACGDRTAR